MSQNLRNLLDAVQNVLDSADDTGCSEDLTVVDSGAVEAMRAAVEEFLPKE